MSALTTVAAKQFLVGLGSAGAFSTVVAGWNGRGESELSKGWSPDSGMDRDELVPKSVSGYVFDPKEFVDFKTAFDTKTLDKAKPEQLVELKAGDCFNHFFPGANGQPQILDSGDGESVNVFPPHFQFNRM